MGNNEAVSGEIVLWPDGECKGGRAGDRNLLDRGGSSLPVIAFNRVCIVKVHAWTLLSSHRRICGRLFFGHRYF